MTEYDKLVNLETLPGYDEALEIARGIVKRTSTEEGRTRMTKLDWLREEMAKKGASKAQLNSKLVAMVLDILTDAGDKYEEMWDEEEKENLRLEEIKRQINRANSEADSVIRQIQGLKDEKQRIENLVPKWDGYIKEWEEYVDKFNKSLEECETAEGRDTLRIAQMFVNTVNVDTKYDNTAYIIGLASILSNGRMSAIDELKKINKNLPSVEDGLFGKYIEIKNGKRRKHLYSDGGSVEVL